VFATDPYLSCLDLWIENYSGIARIPCDSTAFLFYWSTY